MHGGPSVERRDCDECVILCRVTKARLLLVLAGLIPGCGGDAPAKSPTPTVLGEAPGIVNAVAFDDAYLYAVGYHPTNGGFVLRVAAKDLEHYDHIHRDCLSRLPGVSAMKSSFAIRRIKRWRGYPLP